MRPRRSALQATEHLGVAASTPAAEERGRRQTPPTTPTPRHENRRGLGSAAARREALPRRAPKAVGSRDITRYLRAVEHCGSARNTVVALLPFYAGLRIGEVVGLDVTDVALSARKGTLRVRGKGRDGGTLRELPLTRPELRTALTNWLDQRPHWPHAQDSPALLLNRRGGRLSDRAARTIITDLGEHVGLGADTPAGSGFCHPTPARRGGPGPARRPARGRGCSRPAHRRGTTNIAQPLRT